MNLTNLLTNLVLCVIILGSSTAIHAQQEVPFHVRQFPYSDVHMHAAIKPFNSRHVHEYNLWEPIDHDCDGNLANIFINGSEEVPRTSQCNFENCIRGNMQLVYLSLTPLEKGMMDAKLLNEEKKGVATMSCVSGVQHNHIPAPEDMINYYDDFVENIKFIQEGESTPHYIDGQAYTYEVIRNGNHLKEVMADPHKLAVVINIEGGHTLGKSLEQAKEDFTGTEEYHEFFLKNVDRIKGILPLEEGGDKHLDYPVLAMNLNHFFWNGLSGHARTFGGIETFVFGGKDGVDEGMTDLGKKVVKRMLDQTEGRRVLVDVKHMSLASRKWYYSYLQELREKGDTVGIIASHTSIAGVPMDSKEYQKKDNKAKNKDSYMNLWTISLSDDDVREIHTSKGVIGIILDKYRLMGEKAIKQIDETVEGSKQRREFYAKVIWANIFECIDAVDKKSAWDIVAIGSDFDGMVTPFECYPLHRQMPDMAEDMLNFLRNPTDIFDLFTKEEVKEMMFGYTPEEIMKKVMFENGYNFALRNLTTNTTVAK